jgi:imidazolonepropionase-like amidohydrolase
MPFRIGLIVSLLWLAGCKTAGETHVKAIVGAVLLDGSGGPPVTNSVVITGDDKIRAAGAASTVPIPASADMIDGSGRYLIPALVNVYDGSDAKVPGVIHLFQKDAAEFEKARDAKLAIIGHANTLADVKWMVDNGAHAIVGMIGDTQTLDPDFLARLRDLKICFAPALVKAGANLETAQRNTYQMFRAHIPIALATAGGDPQREAELLSDAGIPPQDVIAAITHNGATVLRINDTGMILPPARADLLLLSANPGEDVRNLRKVALRMTAGEIVR